MCANLMNELTHIEIFSFNLSFDVLRLQVSQLGVQRFVVPKQTDGHVQTAEHTFGMGLKFGEYTLSPRTRVNRFLAAG